MSVHEDAFFSLSGLDFCVRYRPAHNETMIRIFDWMKQANASAGGLCFVGCVTLTAPRDQYITVQASSTLSIARLLTF